MSNRLIASPRSLIIAADVSGAAACADLGKSLRGVAGISAFKMGIECGLDGLGSSIDALLREYQADTLFVYDHQKAGNDIPDMGPKFAAKVKQAGCDAAILFPFAGPKTQEKWIKSCQDAGLHVLVGGVMTHENFLVSEGGYIDDAAPERIFRLAVDLGVTDFVVPGTKPQWVRRLREVIEEQLLIGSYDLYAPGFVTQGGDLTECGELAGSRFHPIVGSGIYALPASQRAGAAKGIVDKLAA